MKLALILVSLFAIQSFAVDRPKHDGFLKKTNDAVLLLIDVKPEGHCYALLAKEGRIQPSLNAPTMLINKTSVETTVTSLITRKSNHEFEIRQVPDLVKGVTLPNGDISGVTYELKTKKLVGMTFCAKDNGIADSKGYLVELTIGNRWGALEIPAQTFRPCCAD